MGYKVAVVGATGNVGREMLQCLAEREFPVDEPLNLIKQFGQLLPRLVVLYLTHAFLYLYRLELQNDILNQH